MTLKHDFKHLGLFTFISYDGISHQHEIALNYRGEWCVASQLTNIKFTCKTEFACHSFFSSLVGLSLINSSLSETYPCSICLAAVFRWCWRIQQDFVQQSLLLQSMGSSRGLLDLLAREDDTVIVRVVNHVWYNITIHWSDDHKIYFSSLNFC